MFDYIISSLTTLINPLKNNRNKCSVKMLCDVYTAGDLDAIKLLIEKYNLTKEDVMVTYNYGCTVLHSASRKG